jgi:two-component system chemotaxis response regulator CheY
VKCLIVEDDFASRKLFQTHLTDHGDCYIAVNGQEAVEVFQDALDKDQPYDLILLDIMMPEMDGRSALKAIRKIEKDRGINSDNCVKVIMTTAKDDPDNIMGAYREGCEVYLVKPIKKKILLDELRELGLIE